jgi:hypothetical protein
MDRKAIPRRLKPDGFCSCNGTAEAMPLQSAGAKAPIMLGRLRHDQGRALIQKRLVRPCSATAKPWRSKIAFAQVVEFRRELQTRAACEREVWR